jgi:hypothetical protein
MDNADPRTQAEEEYVDRQDDEWADPAEPNTFPSGGTVEADRADARSDHDADRPPTPDEEEAAPEAVDPAVAEAYEDAMERGAKVKGEGAIDP